MIFFVLQCLYFFLPAYIANMTPSITKNVNFLKYPLDFGLEFRKKRVFGANKTIRGLLFGIIAGTLVFYVQILLYLSSPSFQELSLIDYSSTTIFLGILLSFGALVGDFVESFFKRQIDIVPGKPWMPFDQLDFVVGAILFSLPIVLLDWKAYLVLVFASFILHVGANRTAYLLKLQKNKW